MGRLGSSRCRDRVSSGGRPRFMGFLRGDSPSPLFFCPPPLSPGCSPCPKGWTYFGNSCYFYSKTPSSWENAQRFCSVLGTQLLEVDGPKERVSGVGSGQPPKKGDGGTHTRHAAVPEVLCGAGENLLGGRGSGWKLHVNPIKPVLNPTTALGVTRFLPRVGAAEPSP